MATHNLLSKVDRALAAYLISEGAGDSTNVLTAKSAPDQPNPPYTVCFSETGRQKVDFSGVYSVKARVDVATNNAPTKDEDTDVMVSDSDERVALTFDAFHTRDLDQGSHALAESITAAARAAGVSDFTILECIVGDIEQGDAGKTAMWIDSINLEIVCTPADV